MSSRTHKFPLKDIKRVGGAINLDEMSFFNLIYLTACKQEMNLERPNSMRFSAQCRARCGIYPFGKSVERRLKLMFKVSLLNFKVFSTLNEPQRIS